MPARGLLVCAVKQAVPSTTMSRPRSKCSRRDVACCCEYDGCDLGRKQRHELAHTKSDALLGCRFRGGAKVQTQLKPHAAMV